MEMERVTLAIEGMTCGHCVAAVRKALSSVAGVEGVVVSLSPPRAVVSFDPSMADIETLTKATAEEGYPSLPKPE